MYCDSRKIGPSEKAAGHDKWECQRCGDVGHFLNGITWVSTLCPAWPRPHELGNWLELLLAACFIRKSGYVRLKRLLGFKAACGCDKRQHWLNRLLPKLWGG